VGAVAERVHSGESAAADVARAFRRAEVERRPVLLSMPLDVQTQPAAATPPSSPASESPLAHAEPHRPVPSRATIAEVADLIAAARRPLILAGRGAVLSDAREPLEALGDAIGAVLATSAMGHGLFAGSPWAVGISGGFASPLAAELLPQADVVLAFGATLNHWTTRHGALLGDDAKVIQVDLDPSAIGANRPADVGVVGDVAAAARALAEAVPAAAGWRTPELAAAIAARRWRDEPYEDASSDAYIDPRTLSRALAGLLPADVAIAVDSGHFTGYPAMYLDVADPRAWLFANAFQAVGLGLGCAIGAAVARPDRVTVAALGDGGAFLALAEIETAVRLGLRLLVVVYDDAAYGAEVHHFGPLGQDVALAQFPDADLAAIARAMGAQGITVRATADLDPVRAWLEDDGSPGPLVVDAKVDPTICAAWLEEAFRAG
jgi:thiamine pyrophosphate-dependent acetolactate synthase large subunit-like protein